jgi:hypothetical protein
LYGSAVGRRIKADGKALPGGIAVRMPLPILACDLAEQLKSRAIVECGCVLRQMLLEQRDAERANDVRIRECGVQFAVSEQREAMRCALNLNARGPARGGHAVWKQQISFAACAPVAVVQMTLARFVPALDEVVVNVAMEGPASSM